MIPVRLELKNFMSYGDQVMPLDFTGMRLACLSGDNGNGKSALLDAITWALWGEARASADELVRLGTDEMRVIFDFRLGDDLYRVIRGRSKRSAGNVWEIYIAEGSQEPGVRSQNPEEASPNLQSEICNLKSLDWRPITGQGIRDTGNIIQRILRVDYKTFINSAYIQQGRADEFTKQTVSDRKKILAEILDLSRYDALEQKAKERRNEAEQKLQDLEREIGQIEAELANEDDCRTQLESSRAERGTIEARIAEVESGLRELQARKAELGTAARRVEEMKLQVVGWRTEIGSLLLQKSEQERRVLKSREMLRDKDRILAGQKELHSTRERIVLLDRRLEELRALEHEKASLDQQIMAEKHKLELERQSLAKELSELETKIAGAACIEKDASGLRKQVTELEKLDTRRSEIQSEVSAQSDRWGTLKAQYERQVELKKELEEKLRLISQPGAKCPLCRTELGEEKHKTVIADYHKQIAETDEQILSLKKEGSDAKSKRDAAEKEIARIDEQLRAGLEVRRRLAQAEQVLFQIEEYRKQEPGVRARHTEIGETLKSGGYAQDIRKTLAAVEVKISALEYNADEHRAMKEALAALEEFETLAVSLKHAEESFPGDESNLKSIGDLIGAREKSIFECEETIGNLSKALEELHVVNSEVTNAATSLQALRESDRQITGRIATLEHTLKRCDALRKEIKVRRKDLEKAKQDKAVYSELVAAFGKKGVQALIIENAVPEIQEEANRLLARMTDNAMQVSIETVRDKKTGGTAETLDIRISDDMGTRSYELFSGGEAFRINFALRIALSKLLARRAGARLQTLVVDEGFGTQDGKGREKLVEAIDSIRDDFELILVITHIDELKDAFPTRIEITKDSQGSQISVN